MAIPRRRVTSPYSHCLTVIPARNEEATVGAVVRKVLALGLDVLVIDDASEDNTASVARQAGALVLSAPINLGAWVATQTGIRYAIRSGYPYVITLDADGQHEPADIPVLLEVFSGRNRPNVAIGSCVARGSRLRRLAWSLFSVIGFLRVQDLTSGFRCYDSKALGVLGRREATLLDYQDVGVLLLLRQAGLVVQEVEVSMSPRSSGRSRVFHSWSRVASYMAYSTVLCLTKLPIPSRTRRREPSREDAST